MTKLVAAGLCATAMLGAEAGQFRNPQGSPESRLKHAMPLAWVHTPNSGTTFVNSLIHLPGVCSADVLNAKEDSFWGTKAEPIIFHKNMNKFGHVLSHHEVRHTKKVHKREARRAKAEADKQSLLQEQHGTLQDFAGHFALRSKCSKGLTSNYEWWTHKGIDDHFQSTFKGHGVIMMRQPEQRILSAWFRNEVAWKTQSVEEYAKKIMGCTVKMLTRSHHTPCDDPEPPTKVEMALAKKRLRDFAFVGISDQWTVSIGLFHEMFGGSCKEFELLDETGGAQLQEYDTHKLNGFVDEFDGELYKEAQNIMKDNVKKFNVSWFTPLKHCLPAKK